MSYKADEGLVSLIVFYIKFILLVSYCSLMNRSLLLLSATILLSLSKYHFIQKTVEKPPHSHLLGEMVVGNVGWLCVRGGNM